ncbi:MAG TPA: asparagine synthase (glutamine-hydrolyzing) [Chitinophagaceae bacterium]|nr:asparagine synthase (glutamine-hydrolyzing) [Chitinophagaceae bacterium]
MCGIAGIIQTNPSLYQQLHLKKMTDALAHRGPDGEGHWQNDSQTVLLGHRRLAIIDLSEAAHQPFHFLNRYTIIHNGEIYNYIELREILQKKGYHFSSQSDTEVIVAAYDCWKEDCLQQFDGMFAFAVWDEKEKELFAARDRFGEKPFFYTYDHNRFLFASEMKALWAGVVEKQPNLKMLFNFITIGYTDNPERPEETFYQNIFKLPASSYLKFSFVYFNYTEKKYWNLDPVKEKKSITESEAIEQFNFLLTESVKRRLRSDVAVGASLSGGLDSSSIVTRMCQAGQMPKTFTASFPGFEKDETAFAQLITQQYNLTNHPVSVNGDALITDWEKLCYHQEEPFGSASIYAQYKVYEKAKQQQVKVLLDGQGADETLAGYHKYYKWYWQELFRNRKLSGRKELIAARKLGINEPFTWKNKIAAWFPSFASIVMERQYLARALSHPDLTLDFIQHQSSEAYYTPPDYFNLNGVLYFNTFTHGLEELLRFADRNAMANGVEVRLPFLSHDLVNFLFSLPAHFKIRDGYTKWLLRKTTEKDLPAAIAWRTDKIGFEPPQQQWMELKPVQDKIQAAKEILITEKILKPEVVSKKIKPVAANDTASDDWRYLSAASIFEK